MRLIFIFISFFFCSAVYALSEIDKQIVLQHNLIAKRVKDKTAEFEDQDISNIKILGYKDQLNSLSNWSETSDIDWLSFYNWSETQKLKAKDDNFSVKLRAHKNSELVGRVLKCFGLCYRYRGNLRNQIGFLSQVFEGDEVITSSDSVLWITSIDGSLFRIASNSSVSFNEINISKSKLAIFIRLNKGFVQARPRTAFLQEVQDRPETDLGMHPLNILDANREQYMRLEYQALKELEKSNYEYNINPGHLSQYQALNKLKAENNKFRENLEVSFLLYTPNVSLQFYERPVDLFYGPKGDAIFYVGDHEQGVKDFKGFKNEAAFGLRGYSEAHFKKVETNKWVQVGAHGKKVRNDYPNSFLLEASRKLLSRIPTFLLAAEIWLKEKSIGVLTCRDERELAIKYGYRFWSDEQNEMERRMHFAKEYLKRIETTNLIAIHTLLKNQPVKKFDLSFNSKAMEMHYKALRQRFQLSKINVKNMTKAQYYLWVLKND